MESIARSKMRIYRLAKKKISSKDIKDLNKAKDIIKKVAKSFRDSGVSSGITSLGFDLDEEIYQLTKKD
jgi:hypothetical protein